MKINNHRISTHFVHHLTSFLFVITCVCSLMFALTGNEPVSGQITINEINPDQSSHHNTDADGASGGRINGLASVAGNNNIFYAASEFGGLYKTTNSGRNWARLNNHLPTDTWDVEVSHANQNRVFATSFYDGRVNSVSGINVSNDGGNTWTHPATATPPANFCREAARRDEPAAFGISIDPANAQNVYIGTNCGLAISNDGGTNWQFVDPTPSLTGSDADTVWDVVVHHGGIIDIVGDDGHLRSINGGMNWTTATGTPLPMGLASIAASPHEANVLLATVGANIYESDDGGGSWTNLGTPDSTRQGRIPFVATNSRSTNEFDLWYGDIGLFRGGCTSNPPSGGLRCPMATTADPIPSGTATPTGWAGPFTRNFGGHDDLGDIVFDTQVSNDACPRIFSSDGGVYFNKNTASPGCHSPQWDQPTVTPHGLWLWSLAGVDQPGLNNEDLYFGNQDNGPYATTDAGAGSPNWTNAGCCDVFDTVGESNRAVYTFCCGSSTGRFTSLVRSGQGMTSPAGINDPTDYPPDGLIPGFIFPDVIARFGNSSYAMITRDCGYADGIDNDGDGKIDLADNDEVDGGCTGTNNGDGGIFVTSNIAASPISWTELGNATEPPLNRGFGGACAIKASIPSSGTPTFYVQTGGCSGYGGDRLWRFTGTNSTGTWSSVNLPAGGIGIFDVDPNNPNRLIASQIFNNDVHMVLSTNGGANWHTLDALDNQMTGGGVYRYHTQSGGGYPQPTLVAFDPSDGNTLLAGGANSGLFLSTNGGVSWTTLTDNSGGNANPHLPRPRFTYFDHEGGDLNIYVGTQGRGVWRITLQDRVSDLAITKAATSSTVVTGSNVTYTITITNNGPDAAQNVRLTDMLPETTAFVSCTVSGGTNGACLGTGNDRLVTFDSLAANASATVTITVQVSCALADGTPIPNLVTVGSLARDPNSGNNIGQVTVTASNPPPIITCPADINVGNDPDQCFATVNPGMATATDNCPGVVINGIRNDGFPLSAVYPVGVTIILWKATDSGGRMATCVQTIVVRDTQPPVITCPEDVVAVTAMPGVVTTVVNYTAPKVMDNCPNTVTVCTPPSGSTFSLGTTIVNCKVTDVGGNMANCSFKVTVYDVCLQDDKSGDYLLFNSLTGDYQFTRCGVGGFTVIGRGEITRTPCLTMMSDAKVSATLDRCIIAPQNRGNVTFKPNPIGGWHYITDSSITNNSCACGSTQ